jgi:hypothetical protein
MRVLALGLCLLASSLLAQTPGRHLTDAQWREDLAFMHRTMVADHKNIYHSVTPQQLDQAFAALDHDLPALSDAQITVRLIAIGTLVNDGHSRVDVDGRPGRTHIGLVLVAYPDGLFVREALPENKALLGARVERIGTVPADEALARVRSLIACEPHNDGRTQSGLVSMFLADPLVLNGLDLSSSADEATYTFSQDGHTSTVTLKPSVNGNDMHPFRTSWPSAITQRGDQPFSNPWVDNIAFAEVPAAHAVYLQFNSVYPPPGQTMAQFAAGLEQFIAAHNDDRLVIDLRRNGGGDNTNLRPLLIAIARSRFNHRGHLYVLIGPVTFSAAQNFTSRLEGATEAIFVGQPTGSNVNFYGDPIAFDLLNSHLTVKMSRLWWQDKDPTDTRSATFPEVAIPPDTFADALAGKDAALHYALYASAPSRLEDLISVAAQQGHDQALAALHAYSADPLHRYAESYEDRLNTLASQLATAGKVQTAVVVVQINAETHPSSWQTFDYLGEGYELLHDNTHALAAYRRSLELNPSNIHARQKIEQLQSAR